MKIGSIVFPRVSASRTSGFAKPPDRSQIRFGNTHGSVVDLALNAMTPDLTAEQPYSPAELSELFGDKNWQQCDPALKVKLQNLSRSEVEAALNAAAETLGLPRDQVQRHPVAPVLATFYPVERVRRPAGLAKIFGPGWVEHNRAIELLVHNPRQRDKLGNELDKIFTGAPNWKKRRVAIDLILQPKEVLQARTDKLNNSIIRWDWLDTEVAPELMALSQEEIDQRLAHYDRFFGYDTWRLLEVAPFILALDPEGDEAKHLVRLIDTALGVGRWKTLPEAPFLMANTVSGLQNRLADLNEQLPGWQKSPHAALLLAEYTDVLNNRATELSEFFGKPRERGNTEWVGDPKTAISLLTTDPEALTARVEAYNDLFASKEWRVTVAAPFILANDPSRWKQNIADYNTYFGDPAWIKDERAPLLLPLSPKRRQIPEIEAMKQAIRQRVQAPKAAGTQSVLSVVQPAERGLGRPGLLATSGYVRPGRKSLVFGPEVNLEALLALRKR